MLTVAFIIYKHQKVETTQMSINKKHLWYIHKLSITPSQKAVKC
jgi:hypothetical protein